MKISKLEKFLINRRLLETFKNNLNSPHSYHSTINDLIRREPKFYYIRHSFKWDMSPEGCVFWLAIHYEWEKCLDENTL